jgi:tetratricopeptide (TPR) repeat protein
MKISFFYILFLIAFFSSGCAGLLKTFEQSDVRKSGDYSHGEHESSAKDISKEKKKQLPSKTRQKKLKVKAEKERKRKEEIEHNITIAKKYLAEKKYDKALETTKKIRTLDPKNKNALSLENEAHYMAGKTLYMEHQYTDSLKMFENIKNDYKDVKKISASIKTQMKKEAETHYKKGVKYFINEELKKAIAEWEKTLLLNPNHPKAVKDIENAKHLLMELEKIK